MRLVRPIPQLFKALALSFFLGLLMPVAVLTLLGHDINGARDDSISPDRLVVSAETRPRANQNALLNREGPAAQGMSMPWQDHVARTAIAPNDRMFRGQSAPLTTESFLDPFVPKIQSERAEDISHARRAHKHSDGPHVRLPTDHRPLYSSDYVSSLSLFVRTNERLRSLAVGVIHPGTGLPSICYSVAQAFLIVGASGNLFSEAFESRGIRPPTETEQLNRLTSNAASLRPGKGKLDRFLQLLQERSEIEHRLRSTIEKVDLTSIMPTEARADLSRIQHEFADLLAQTAEVVIGIRTKELRAISQQILERRSLQFESVREAEDFVESCAWLTDEIGNYTAIASWDVFGRELEMFEQYAPLLRAVGR